MKSIVISLALAAVLLFGFQLGCFQPSSSQKFTSLHPLGKADMVKLRNSYGGPIPVNEIRDQARIDKLQLFINALPPKWSVPWSGPPVGKISISFYEKEKFVGNFDVGPDFFGRNGSDFWSQSASKQQIQEVGIIAGFDLWSYINEK